MGFPPSLMAIEDPRTIAVIAQNINFNYELGDK
jgi:hypothetical protein